MSKKYILSAILACLSFSSGYADDLTKAIENTRRRANQMLNIRWTPIDTIWRKTAKSSYKADSIYYGLPYSQVKEYNKYVGFDVNFTTFMTAINNPYSVMYTENVNKNKSSSAYGIVYKGDKTYSYMGIDCSTFVGYSLGLTVNHKTAEYKNLEDFDSIISYMRVKEPKDLNVIEEMDVIWKDNPGHVRLVTKVHKDSNGNVDSVEIAQSTTSSPQITTRIDYLPIQEVTDSFHKQQSILYRYKKRAENTNYTPIPFLTYDGKTSVEYDYNNDICTYRGDSCSFRLGEMIIINYNLKEVKDWNTLLLYNENDDTIASVVINPATHYINITSYIKGAGKYKACLTNGSQNSDYTYFEVIDTYAKIVDGNLKFSSDYGTPLFADLCLRSGSVIGRVYLFTADDRDKGSIDMSNIQYSKTYYKDSILYVKVHFQGEYGRVTSIPFPIKNGSYTYAQYFGIYGVYFLGKTEEGELPSTSYIVFPDSCDAIWCFENYSVGADNYYWTWDGETYDDGNQAIEFAFIMDEGEAKGTTYDAPIAYADTASFMIADSMIALDRYWAANHVPQDPLVDSRFTMGENHSHWTKILSPYKTVTVKGFAEYFRHSDVPYTLNAVDITIFVSDTSVFNPSPIQLKICKATANNDWSLLTASETPLDTWTNADTTFIEHRTVNKNVPGTFYTLHFTGKQLTIDTPITLELVLDEESKEETTFSICHTKQQQRSPDAAQSAFVIVNSDNGEENTEFLYPAYMRYERTDSTFNGYDMTSDHKVYDHNRSFCFYMDIQYIHPEKEEDPDGISEVNEVEKNNDIIRYYDLSGRQVNEDAKGIIITSDHRKITRF